MTHGNCPFDSEADVLDHLSGIDLKREDTLHPGGKLLDFLDRERPQAAVFIFRYVRAVTLPAVFANAVLMIRRIVPV